MGTKILVVGDALEDIHYISNKPFRVSAETDIPIHDIVDIRVDPGGAANIVRSLQNLGLECDFLYGLNDNLGVPQKCRVYSEGQQVCRFDINDRVKPIWIEFLEPKLTNIYSAIVVGDYGKGSVGANIREALIDYSQKYHVPMFINTKGDPILWWTSNNNQTTLFCNDMERDMYAASYDKFSNYVCTSGEEGAALFASGSGLRQVEALAPRVVDVNGAGDVFMATYIARAIGTPMVAQHLPSALAYASVAAAIAIQRPYTSYIHYQELKEAWYEYNESNNPSVPNKGHNPQVVGG